MFTDALSTDADNMRTSLFAISLSIAIVSSMPNGSDFTIASKMESVFCSWRRQECEIHGCVSEVEVTAPSADTDVVAAHILPVKTMT